MIRLHHAGEITWVDDIAREQWCSNCSTDLLYEDTPWRPGATLAELDDGVVFDLEELEVEHPALREAVDQDGVPCA